MESRKKKDASTAFRHAFNSRKITVRVFFGLYFRVNPIAMITLTVFTVFVSLLPYIQLKLNSIFIDNILQMNIKERSSIISVLFISSLILISLILLYISNNLLEILIINISEKAKKEFRHVFTYKTAALRYPEIEDDTVLSLLKRISDHSETIFKEILDNTISVFKFIVNIAGLLYALSENMWWLSIITILLLIPFSVISIKSGRIVYNVNKQYTNDKRKYEHLSDMVSKKEFSYERYTFGYTNRINNRYFSDFEKTRKIESKTRLLWYSKSGLGSILTVVVSVLFIFVLLDSVVDSRISIGFFVSIINYFYNLTRIISWDLPNTLYKHSIHRELIKDLNEFSFYKINNHYLDKPAVNCTHFQTLEFIDVSFSYPGSTNKVLEHLSFLIEKGKHYAFVGKNGAGKSTITKIVLGLYDNYEGTILLNGRNLREYSPAELKSFFAPLFQDFANYYISLYDNIAIGDINNYQEEGLESKITEALRKQKVSFHMQNLPEGLQSILGKIDSQSINLSKGEWQQVALTRVYYNPSPLKILDEPTASLDPIEESLVFEQLTQLYKGGSSILISHRFTSVRYVDTIFVLSQGKIVEKGSHNDLMKIKGLYCEMFNEQKWWYE